MRPAAEYELDPGYEPPADPHYAGASFAETRTDYTFIDDPITAPFNAAASGADQAEPAAGDTEDETAGAHSAAGFDPDFAPGGPP